MSTAIADSSLSDHAAGMWETYRRTGSTADRNALVELYWPRARQIAARLAERLPRCVDIDDLASVGVIALIAAVDRYDPARSSFATFAGYRLRGAMLDYLRENDDTPRLVRNRSRDVMAARETFYAQHGRQPTRDELRQELDVSEPELARHLSARPLFVDSLSEVVFDSDHRQTDRSQLLADDRSPDPTYRAEVADEIRDALKALSPRERIVVTLNLGHGMSLREIAPLLNLHDSRVSQIRTDARRRLPARPGGIGSKVA